MVEVKNSLKDAIDRISGNEIESFNFLLSYKTDTENIITNTYFSKIVDKFGDFIGILVISKENKSIKQFKKIYKLTERQLEVIELCVAGHNNDEISGKLLISKKTTESHFFNIYNKLGINNKIELFNLLNEYGVTVKIF